MEFDPSAFLSMAMTEDQDAEYTAPDVPQGFSPAKVPAGNIVVEGGLQMEQGMQIPVPVFGLLQQDESEGEEREANESHSAGPEVPVHIDTAEPESSKSSTPQPSPGERTVSPCNRKIIPTTHDETRFRKELFSGHYERVKMFRLHCTICEKHLGCAPWFTERQMRMHKLLSVVVCRKCFEFYGDINFPIDEGSELFCSWCGQGGDCFCCSTCPKIVCKKCVKQNFGASKVKEIDKNDDWACFVCKPEDIWPHRAVMWGLQRWSKGMRQLVAMLPKEEKQTRLSMDTSHCCLKVDQEITPVGLPPKAVLSKIPLGMIALPYQIGVREVLARQETYSSLRNGIFPPNSPITYGPTTNLPPTLPEMVTHVPGNFTQLQQQVPRAMVSQQQQQQIPMNMMTQQQQRQIPRTMMTQQQQRQIPRVSHQQQQQIPRAMVGYHVRQMVHRNAIMINRPAPYLTNRNMPNQPPPLSQPSHYAPRLAGYPAQHPYRLQPPGGLTTSSQPTEFIDLDKDSALHPTNKPLMDISSLENGVRDVRNALGPTLMMLDQFDMIKTDVASDFEKLTSFSDRLSYNIKIAICNLAKANTDLIESQRTLIDKKVSTVVDNIQYAIENYSPAVNRTRSTVNQNGIESSPKRSNPHMIIDSSPEIIELNHNSPSKTPEPNRSSVERTTSATPFSSTGEEVEDVTIALLCETVLEVGENKENKDDANKDQAAPVKGSQQVRKPVKGKPNIKTNRKRPRDQNDSSEIQFIDLVDDEEEKKGTFDESLCCKKYNIVPCKVVLERLEILKVDVV